MTLENADIEGKYEILEKMREGGMGALYKVRHRLLEDIRVIKVIRPQFAGQKELDQRFRLEARTAIRLRHPNIAQIYDFSVAEDGTAFIVMEFIDGMTFQEMLGAGGPRELALTLEVARQGLRALSYLHQRGYVHRDIASDNLMLTRDFDGSPLVKLIDLGIVKRLTGQAGITATGTFMGKARYSAPEHFSSGGGSAKVDARSDLYSYGVLLYELLTGEFPVVGNDFSEIIAGHLFRPPRPFSETDPQGRIPGELADLVIKTLDKDPALRVASADELAEKLGAFQDRNKEELAGELGPALSREAPAGGPPAASSTTRRRLERAFADGTTPQPAPLESLPDEDDSRVRRRRQLNALLDDARLLAQLDQPKEARLKVRELLDRDPGNTEAKRLLRALEVTRQASPLEAKIEARPGARAKSKGKPRGAAGGRAEAEPRRETGPKSTAARDKAPPEAAARREPEAPPVPASPASAAPPVGGEGAPKASDDPATVAATVIAADLDAGRISRARQELELALSLYGREPALGVLEERLAALPSAITATQASSPPAARRRGLPISRPLLLAAAGVAALALLLVLVLRQGDGPPAGGEAAVAEEGAEPGDSGETAAGDVPAPGEAPAAGPAPDPGTLLLDALPWAKVRSIKGPDGALQPLGGEPYTPFRIALPPGRYAVDLAGRSGFQRDPIEVEIRSGEVIERLVDLGRPDVDEYFREAGL